MDQTGLTEAPPSARGWHGPAALARLLRRPGQAGAQPSARRAALLGALLAASSVLAAGTLGGAPIDGARLGSASEAELVTTLDSLQRKTVAAREELARLELELASRQAAAERQVAEIEAAEREIEDLEVLSGLVAARGPGVIVEIRGETGTVPFELLLDLVQELRDAGAEALAINGWRLGASASFGVRRDAVTVDGRLLRPPYRMAAIGDPSTLEGGLRIPGGSIETLAALEGAEVSVERRRDVRVAALAEPRGLERATPVE
ncbi:MAG: DUF881 domain-containing protein [Acidimicrobiia bacterium]